MPRRRSKTQRTTLTVMIRIVIRGRSLRTLTQVKMRWYTKTRFNYIQLQNHILLRLIRKQRKRHQCCSDSMLYSSTHFNKHKFKNIHSVRCELSSTQ